MINGDPATFDMHNAPAGTYHSGAHGGASNGPAERGQDWPVTNVFDNVRFINYKNSSSPVRNMRCSGGWCLYNSFDTAPTKCNNDGDWGWTFHRPVKRVALSTPDLPNFKAATVWLYDRHGAVLGRRIIGENHRGNAFIAFSVTCGAKRNVISRIRLEVHDYLASSHFCISKIWYDGQREARQCSHTTCRHETHSCENWRQDKWGMVTHHALARGACVRTQCGTNGNCNGVDLHTSIRVYHKLVKRNTGMGKDEPESLLERHCRISHHCGMGVASGNKKICECKEL